MINILSYIGINLQSEVCLWSLLGLVRTIFDATLFKVNANLKQVWQMSMPPELSLPVQRILRTMISGVMLVQCFTVYVYLASYIILLYPVFLEERPSLVLPWLLLAAIRKLLCELTSLALGLGTCVLLGPARTPCIRFLITKLLSILPAVYMWSLVYSYYHTLKMASAFKTFAAVISANNDPDYGLELAVRRRRTKSLQGEEQLRKKLVAHFYADRPPSPVNSGQLSHKSQTRLSNADDEDIPMSLDIFDPSAMLTTRAMSDLGTYHEDWFGNEVNVPRVADRILEQFVLMLLSIGAYLKKDNVDISKLLNSSANLTFRSNIECAPISSEENETPSVVGNNRRRMASYLSEYPNIFMKKNPDALPSLRSDHKIKSENDRVDFNDKLEKTEAENILLDTTIDVVSSSISEDSRNDISNNPHMSDVKDNVKATTTNNKKTKSIQLKSDSQESLRNVIERMKKRANFIKSSDISLGSNSSEDKNRKNKTRKRS